LAAHASRHRLVAGRAAEAQAPASPLPSSPLVRPADTILQNGRIITVDAAFTITPTDRDHSRPHRGRISPARETRVHSVIGPRSRIPSIRNPHLPAR
jgi:hypothetical protein